MTFLTPQTILPTISGSFATASCLVCKHKVDCEAIREDIFNQVFDIQHFIGFFSLERGRVPFWSHNISSVSILHYHLDPLFSH